MNLLEVTAELQKKSNKSKCVYGGIRFDVHQVELPGATGIDHVPSTVTRDVCVTSDAVVILPLLSVDSVVLIRNERFAVGETLWELPAGTTEPGELPLQTARRELIEETGYQAERVAHLIDFFTSPGICTETMHAFVARGLRQVGQDLDENERITPEVVDLKQTMKMVADNTIRDAKTIATLLYYVANRSPNS